MKRKMRSGKVALVATMIALVGLTQIPSASADNVTRKNSDGSVDVYDQDDPNAPQGDGQETVQSEGGGASGGGGGVRYVPGTSPYTKKYSDGTVVHRNPDGSIETSSPEETTYWGSQASTGGGGAKHARSKKRVKTVSKAAATKKAATTTAKKAK